jgi:hypothetical protein
MLPSASIAPMLLSPTSLSDREVGDSSIDREVGESSIGAMDAEGSMEQNGDFTCPQCSAQHTIRHCRLFTFPFTTFLLNLPFIPGSGGAVDVLTFSAN